MNINSYELNIQIVELVFFCDCFTRFKYFVLMFLHFILPFLNIFVS